MEKNAGLQAEGVAAEEELPESHRAEDEAAQIQNEEEGEEMEIMIGANSNGQNLEMNVQGGKKPQE